MEGLALYIDDRFRNRKVDFFNEFTFTLAYDSVGSTFGFNLYFDPYNIEHKELACVTHYHIVRLQYRGELLITGNITSQRFTQTNTKRMASIGGYSLPGVLEDCQIPTSSYPLQSDGLNLRQIASKLLRPFKIDFEVDPAVSGRMGKAFEKATATETQSVKDFLTQLASQKDIIISHNAEGVLLFTEAKTNTDPVMVLDLREGVQLGTEYELEYDGQSMHSHITVIKQADLKGGNAGQVEVRNPYVIGSVFRPKVVTQTSGDDIDTSEAAKRELANELRGVKLKIKTDRWLDKDNNLLVPNTLIQAFSPELYLYRMTTWFIESITYQGNNKQTTATLNCVLPEVYNRKTPSSIFRNINLHALEP